MRVSTLRLAFCRRSTSSRMVLRAVVAGLSIGPWNEDSSPMGCLICDACWDFPAYCSAGFAIGPVCVMRFLFAGCVGVGASTVVGGPLSIIA